MFKRYTIENTVDQGFRAELTLNGTARDRLTEIWKFGPFVLAWGYLTDAAGRLVTNGRGEIAPRCHIGIGRVTLSPIC